MHVKVRVAFGTGAVLGLWDGRIEVAPTTAHFLIYQEKRCRANCTFCPQASGSSADLRMLSRVVWPVYDLDRVVQSLSSNPEKFQRICIQSVNYPKSLDDVCTIVKKIKEVSKAPISVSSNPISVGEIDKLKSAGVDRLCIPLDACTPEIFSRTKEGYDWEKHIDALEHAGRVFDGVTTHLIIGLGETEEEAVRALQILADKGITVGLFALTPIRGTQLEKQKQPELSSYRRIQLARYLMQKKITSADKMRFTNGVLNDFGVGSEVLNEVVSSGAPFKTSGCDGCNRPFYNESPRGPIYNFPREPTIMEIEEIKKTLALE